MSLPSPPRNGGNSVPPPKQIRFVSTDGQPQTKRRRVNAACRTCRKRKIRCSGEQPVCKTCSDYNHECLGYEASPHARSQTDGATRTPAAAPQLPGPSQSAPPRADSKVDSRTPDSPPQAAPPSKAKLDKPSETPRLPALNDGPVTREPFSRTTKEPERQTAGDSPESTRTSLSSSARTHVPYFRYFGPTAIVPGFKQMVVQVRGSRKSNPSQSSGSYSFQNIHVSHYFGPNHPALSLESLPSCSRLHPADPLRQNPESLSPLRSPRLADTAASHLNNVVDGRDSRDANIPFYDKDDSLPVSNLVTHLCDLFFVHLGCSFPFLQRERFLRDLADKKVDNMLVDAVCALAARFSLHPLLSPPQAPSIDGSEPQVDTKSANRGKHFAQRAMSALVSSLPCPTLSVVQACLLLAYEQFGANRDSGLWMYLGIAIRMAQDLGMQKVQGLKFSYGQRGVTPNAVLTGHAGKLREDQYDDPHVPQSPMKKAHGPDGWRAWERERVDTFWSIFFLDRVISSGTGRPVTLRDEDIELCFPLQSESQLSNGWPAPFPPLIRIIHLYGRVTDLINGIQDVKNVTTETLKSLAGMESDLTGIYQRLSPRLHFNAANFQTYVKAKEGTNFILLHFWFHTLIVLLHQPTLLNSFGGTIQHLYPNSRELSVSSAKTIADILSFSELVDGKSFIGNPFTSQPMYIAACAFLMESAYYCLPSSRCESPPNQPLLANQTSGFVMPNIDPSNGTERKATAKHILLASAAKDNYQRCYKALKALEDYWEGTRYILTVLDQKAKGIVDPLLYTVEEMENTSDSPQIQQLATSNWRRSKSSGGNAVNSDGQATDTDGLGDGRRSPRIDPSQAIGWALTGATNSSQPNLSLLYQMPADQAEPVTRPTYSSQYSHSLPSIQVQQNAGQGPSSFTHPLEPPRTTTATPSSMGTPSDGFSPLAPSRRTATSDANLLLGLNAPYPNPGSRPPNSQAGYAPNISSSSRMGNHPHTTYDYNMPSAGNAPQASSAHLNPNVHADMTSRTGDVFIESQDIDMAALQHQDQLPFAFSGDILPWLEYLPQDVLSYFGEHQNYPHLMNPDDGTPQHPE